MRQIRFASEMMIFCSKFAKKLSKTAEFREFRQIIILYVHIRCTFIANVAWSALTVPQRLLRICEGADNAV